MIEGQMTLWDLLDDKPKPYFIDKPIRLIELFAGIGSQAMSLRDLGANFEHYRVVEFDKYAIASYNAIHGTDFPTMDVTKLTGEDLGIVDSESFTYLLTYSFPCTDLSVAGKMAGMEEGSGTRSSLLWEVRRLLEETKELPQILMMENVPQVHSKQNMPSFQKWLDYLEGKGYKNYWQDMNAKNYGVAQPRNRTIMISLLGNYSYTFPTPFPLEKCMKDYLEPEVEEKYYLNNDKARDLIEKLIVGGKLNLGQNGVDLCYTQAETVEIPNCITSRYDAGINKHKYERTGVVECEKIGGGQQITATLNLNKVDKVNPDIANTLCARDYKGFGTGFNTMNGVIECQKLK